MISELMHRSVIDSRPGGPKAYRRGRQPLKKIEKILSALKGRRKPVSFAPLRLNAMYFPYRGLGSFQGLTPRRGQTLISELMQRRVIDSRPGGPKAYRRGRQPLKKIEKILSALKGRRKPVSFAPLRLNAMYFPYRGLGSFQGLTPGYTLPALRAYIKKCYVNNYYKRIKCIFSVTQVLK